MQFAITYIVYMLERLTIHDFSPKNKPRERLRNLGTQALSDAELLTIIIRTGGKQNSALDLSLHLLKKYKGFGGLISADLNELMCIKDLGFAKATCIKALGEITLRFSTEKAPLLPVITAPNDVYDLMKQDLYGKKQEHVYVLSLGARNELLSKNLIFTGTVNESIIHPREVFKTALLKSATSVILVHNHPSDNSMPSESDIVTTNKISKAGVILGIGLTDHIIVTSDGYTSMKKLNLLSSNNFSERG
jgi:DNA repair protein RadC